MCFPYRQNNGTNMIRADGFTKREATLEDRGGRRRPPAEMLHLLSAVAVWLVTGSTISSLNKWIFAVFNFRYPLLLSALHMLTAIVVDYGLIKLRVIRHIGVREQDLTPSAKCKVFMLSLTFCASIAFGNMGLNYVQLSFAQMIYTTTPIFTLAISTLVLGKQHHILKYTAMMPICLGASFSIMGEVQFDQTGCLFVFAATMLRGVKSIQQSEFFCCGVCLFFCVAKETDTVKPTRSSGVIFVFPRQELLSHCPTLSCCQHFVETSQQLILIPHHALRFLHTPEKVDRVPARTADTMIRGVGLCWCHGRIRRTATFQDKLRIQQGGFLS